MIRVLYFARLREALGSDGEDIQAGDIATVAALKASLAARGAGPPPRSKGSSRLNVWAMAMPPEDGGPMPQTAFLR